MKAKEIYNRHLKICTPDGYQSEKQMVMYRNEAAINAIEELLEQIEADKLYEELRDSNGFSN